MKQSILRILGFQGWYYNYGVPLNFRFILKAFNPAENAINYITSATLIKITVRPGYTSIIQPEQQKTKFSLSSYFQQHFSNIVNAIHSKHQFSKV